MVSARAFCTRVNLSSTPRLTVSTAFPCTIQPTLMVRVACIGQLEICVTEVSRRRTFALCPMALSLRSGQVAQPEWRSRSPIVETNPGRALDRRILWKGGASGTPAQGRHPWRYPTPAYWIVPPRSYSCSTKLLQLTQELAIDAARIRTGCGCHRPKRAFPTLDLREMSWMMSMR